MDRLGVNGVVQRDRKVYWPRLDPFTRNTERQFIGKYRLDKVTVQLLAQRFGESEFANLGSGMGGGLSHASTVSRNRVGG